MRWKIPEVLTATEQDAIVAQPNPRYLTGHRNRVMLRLMLDTGLRLSEVIHLQWKDIDLNSDKVMVRQGKGAKDRTLWTGEANLEVLVEWQERQGRKPSERLYDQGWRQVLDARYIPTNGEALRSQSRYREGHLSSHFTPFICH